MTTESAQFSVTLPTSLPVHVDASGSVTVATDAKITNNSVGPIKVMGCLMEVQNGWSITTDPSIANIGAKEFNFTLNSKAFGQDGSYDASDWESINASGTLALVYESEVAPQKEDISESMANVVFTVDWDEDQGTTPDKPVLNAIHEVDKDKLAYRTLKSLTGTIAFRDSTEVPATYDSATDISTAGDGSVMAYITGQDATIQADGGILAPQNSSSMFRDYAATSMDLRGLDTSNAINMSLMFYQCMSLSNLDISGFDTSNATTMYGMFQNCRALTTLDVGSFDTHNVVDMHNMFSSCHALTSLNIDNFDTINVSDMRSMFQHCWELTALDLSNFNTSNVTDMSAMFDSCYALTTLDISRFDTSNIGNMRSMFGGCEKLITLDLSNFNTSNVTDMYGMFSGCYALTNLELSSFNTSNVTNMEFMFSACNSLVEVDLSSFDLTSATSIGNIFNNCKVLTTVYTRTQADADKLNTESGKPDTVNIIVKT